MHKDRQFGAMSFKLLSRFQTHEFYRNKNLPPKSHLILWDLAVSELKPSAVNKA